VVRVLAGFLEVLEPRVTGRVLHDERAKLLADQSGQPLAQPHPHAADAFRPQPYGRSQHQRRSIGLEEVDRADVAFESPLNELDDVGQRFSGVAAVGNQAADLLPGPQKRILLPGGRHLLHGVVSRRWKAVERAGVARTKTEVMNYATTMPRPSIGRERRPPGFVDDADIEPSQRTDKSVEIAWRSLQQCQKLRGRSGRV